MTWPASAGPGAGRTARPAAGARPWRVWVSTSALRCARARGCRGSGWRRAGLRAGWIPAPAGDTGRRMCGSGLVTTALRRGDGDQLVLHQRLVALPAVVVEPAQDVEFGHVAGDAAGRDVVGDGAVAVDRAGAAVTRVAGDLDRIALGQAP